MNNLEIYNKIREVPAEAKKEIKAGRLKGFTDINPMWRIKTLTETFGPCGIGWKYAIKNKWIEQGGLDTQVANVEIELFIKQNGEWSDPIPGIGGSSFVAMESKGLYTSDEHYKMALTDAISVACKALGMGANVYWEKDASKYDNPQEPLSPEQMIEAARIEVMNYAMANEEWKLNLLTYMNLQNIEDMNDEQIKAAYRSALKNQGK